MITYGFVKDGGFAARDDATGHCYYCYPKSSNAEAAKWQPEFIATSMLRRANDQARTLDTSAYDERISAALEEMSAAQHPEVTRTSAYIELDGAMVRRMGA